jgi:dolichyl-phosphate-mannose--protein O-mannosyl transferase
LGKSGRWVMPGYAALTIAVFVNFYPFWSAYPISQDDMKGSRYFWFDSWRRP